MTAETTGRSEIGPALEPLWHLQQTDLRLAGARAQRLALDDGSTLRAEADAARAAAEAAAARLHECQATLRDHELRLESTEAKQKKIEGDLYGGRVSNPKELASLQEDLASLGRTRDHLEDRILALLDQLETLKSAAAAAADLDRSLAHRLAAHLEAYEGTSRRLEAEIDDLTAQRIARAAEVEPRLLKKYEGIAAQERGVGIVAIQQGRCAGCHNAVPLDFVTRVRDGRLVTCERCHRILYLETA